MKNNLPVLGRITKKWNNTLFISAFISNIVQDICRQKLGYTIEKLQVIIKENSIVIQCNSSLIASELQIYSKTIKKSSQTKLLKLGYILSDSTRLYIR